MESNSKKTRKEKLKKLRGEIDIAMEETQSNDPTLPTYFLIDKFAAARAAEIQRLLGQEKINSIGKSPHQLIPRHLRRRSMAHNAHLMPQSIREKALTKSAQTLPTNRANPKTKTKRKKRKTSRSKKIAQRLKKQCASKWLETHLWLAKRMHMASLWGFRIPIAPTSKSSKFLQQADLNSCTLFDASFLVCFEISFLHAGKEREDADDALKSMLAFSASLVCAKDTGALKKMAFAAFAQSSENERYDVLGVELEGAFCPAEFYWEREKLKIWVHCSVAEALEKNLRAKQKQHKRLTVSNRQHHFVRFSLHGRKCGDTISSSLAKLPESGPESDKLGDPNAFKAALAAKCNGNTVFRRAIADSPKGEEILLLSRKVPISDFLLVDESNRWDLVIPSEHGYKVWLALILNGARVMGLKNHIESCLNRKERYFPLDYCGHPRSKELVADMFGAGDNSKIAKKAKFGSNFSDFYSRRDFDGSAEPNESDLRPIRLKLLKGNPHPFCKILFLDDKPNQLTSSIQSDLQKNKFFKFNFNSKVSGIPLKNIGFTTRKIYSHWNGCVLMFGFIQKERENMPSKLVAVFDEFSRNAYLAEFECYD